MSKPRMKYLSLAILSCCAVWAAPAVAYDLKEAAQEAALHNPEVVSKFHAFREASEGVDVARGGYYPKLDVSMQAMRERLHQNGVQDIKYPTEGATVYLNQMLFDGFATRSEVERLSYAQRVRYFELLDMTEATALEVARAYNDVLRYRKLAELAQENYIQHRAIYEQINRRVKAGVGRQVDLEQAGGRLALAESNLLVETSNLHDVSARFQRIVGKAPPADMKDPALLNKEVPKDKNTAVALGYKNNPTILAAQENIVAAMAEARGTKAAFMPKLYFQARHDFGQRIDGVFAPNPETWRTSYGLVMNMNLYNGGSDNAKQRQVSERLNVAKDLRDKACRDIRQAVSIGFNDLKKLAEQIEYLDQHQLSTEKARDAYRKQFDIGQRTLLDLLDTENELFDSRRAYQNGLRDQFYAYARTQAGMGQLLQQMGLQHIQTEGLAAQEEIAEFDPAAICPAEGELAVTVDKDKLFADAVKAKPELLPPENYAAPKPAAAAPAPAPKAAKKK